VTQPTKTDRVLSVLFGPKNTSELFMTLVGLVLLAAMTFFLLPLAPVLVLLAAMTFFLLPLAPVLVALWAAGKIRGDPPHVEAAHAA